MAKGLYCTFQHYISGLHIGATYERKRLKLGLIDDIEYIKEIGEDESVYYKTEKWCNEHNNKRFETVEDAINYLRKQGIDDYLDFE